MKHISEVAHHVIELAAKPAHFLADKLHKAFPRLVLSKHVTHAVVGVTLMIVGPLVGTALEHVIQHFLAKVAEDSLIAAGAVPICKVAEKLFDEL